MNSETRLTIQEQIDSKLEKKMLLPICETPSKGWINVIRRGLGMTIRDLAFRMDVSKSLIGQMEKNEVKGSLTFDSLAKVADAMDCVVVYALVPKTSLEDTVYNQAKKIAQTRVGRVAHTMELEGQGLSDQENKQLVIKETKKLIEKMPLNFWKTK